MEVERKKVKLEIYEGDPFGSACCGPGPRITSLEAAKKLREMLTERNRTIEKLSGKYRNSVEIEREIISLKRHDYPDHVTRTMAEDKPLPYIFINGEAAVIGEFPSYEEFVTLLEKRLESTEHLSK
jgi:hypothetical protein